MKKTKIVYNDKTLGDNNKIKISNEELDEIKTFNITKHIYSEIAVDKIDCNAPFAYMLPSSNKSLRELKKIVDDFSIKI
ncbi:MAG: hypothetical protein E6929_03980 [Clostridium sp.]|nr:hypothetical protein [Clostridium sp.]